MLRAFAGGRLFGAAFGPTPARVLALPGWRHDHRDFAAALDGLPALGIDPPGFGTTPEPPEAWGARGYADAVATLLDELDTPAVLVGHSFGGRIAVHLAASHPDRVGAVVLAGVPLLRRQDRPAAAPPLGFRLGKALHRIGLLPDERMERLRRRHGSADYRASTGVMRDVLVRTVNESYEEPLQTLRCPVELLWGDGDDQAPVEVAERAAAIVGERARLTVLPGVGHMVPTEAPDELRAVVERHLATA